MLTAAVRQNPVAKRITEHTYGKVVAHWLTGARDRDGGKKNRLQTRLQADQHNENDWTDE